MIYKVFLLAAVLLPIVSGAALLFLKIRNDKARNIATFVVSIINLGLVIGALVSGSGESFVLYDTGFALKITFGLDGMSRFFSRIVSVLWPFSLLYAYEYMEGEENKNSFFAFFMMTLGSVIGVSFAGDLFTMYIFYELITLFTFPLVMHERTKEAVSAGRKYLVYMLGGAGFALHNAEGTEADEGHFLAFFQLLLDGVEASGHSLFGSDFGHAGLFGHGSD